MHFGWGVARAGGLFSMYHDRIGYAADWSFRVLSGAKQVRSVSVRRNHEQDSD